MKIDCLFEGCHEMQPSGDGVDIYKFYSAVTLIQVEKTNILIDVSNRGMITKIQEKLAERNLKLENINTIVLTHFHLDHAYNIAFFPNAKLFGWMHEWKQGSCFRVKDISEYFLQTGIQLIPTPGHTPEHLSVLARDDEDKLHVISGDAINQHYVDTKKVHAQYYDESLYIKSAENILQMADIIIPGHGPVIKIQRKEQLWTEKMVEIQAQK